MESKCINLVTKFSQGCCSRSTSKTGTHHNDFELALVVGVDQLHVCFVVVPFVCNGTIGNFAIQLHCVLREKILGETHMCLLSSECSGLADNAGHNGNRE